MTVGGIDSFITKWIASDKSNQNQFFKKLILYWPEIVADKKFARYSTPGRIIQENTKSTLIIFSYSGPVTIYLQGMITKLEQNIKLHIGYFPVNSIRIIQKSAVML
jgi:hypothetical protein